MHFKIELKSYDYAAQIRTSLDFIGLILK